MRTKRAPQIPGPVVGPGSPWVEKSTLGLSAFLTCGSQRDWGPRESGRVSKWRTGQFPVLPGVQAPSEDGLRQIDPNREAGILALVGTFGGPRAG